MAVEEPHVPIVVPRDETQVPLIVPHNRLRELVRSNRYQNWLLGLLIACLLSFHPWIMTMVEQALQVMPLLLLVLIFVYVVNPMVEFVLRQIRKIPGLERFSYTRSLLVTYLLLLLCLGGLLALVVPKLVQEVRDLASSLPGYVDRVKEQVEQYRTKYFDVLAPEVQEQINDNLRKVGEAASQLMQNALKYLGALSGVVAFVLGATIFVPLIGFYILKDGANIVQNLLRFSSEHNHPRYQRILQDIHRAMQNFLKGQLILCIIIGVVTTLAMFFVLPRYCIALGLIAAVTEAIPVVGPFLGAIPAVIIGFAAGGPSLGLVVIVIYLVIQQLENVVLVPRVMGEQLGLHPISLIVGMMVFGNVFGFWGVVLAAPLVATIKVLVNHLILRDEPEIVPVKDETPVAAETPPPA